MLKVLIVIIHVTHLKYFPVQVFYSVQVEHQTHLPCSNFGGIHQ